MPESVVVHPQCAEMRREALREAVAGGMAGGGLSPIATRDLVAAGVGHIVSRAAYVQVQPPSLSTYCSTVTVSCHQHPDNTRAASLYSACQALNRQSPPADGHIVIGGQSNRRAAKCPLSFAGQMVKGFFSYGLGTSTDYILHKLRRGRAQRTPVQ